MRKSLVLAVVAVALDVLAPVFGAQAYVVNGQAAARAEVQVPSCRTIHGWLVRCATLRRSPMSVLRRLRQ